MGFLVIVGRGREWFLFMYRLGSCKFGEYFVLRSLFLEMGVEVILGFRKNFFNDSNNGK